MDLNEQIERIQNRKHLWLICPVCAWFAPFGPYTAETKPSRPRDRCNTCNSELLWERVPNETDNLFYSAKWFDPDSTIECGNGFTGFTSKMALTFIWSQNDISWWLK